MALQSSFLISLALLQGGRCWRKGGSDQALRAWSLLLASYLLAFSVSGGIVHAYYAAALSPAIAILAAQWFQLESYNWIDGVAGALAVLQGVFLMIGAPAFSNPSVKVATATGLLVFALRYLAVHGARRYRTLAGTAALLGAIISMNTLFSSAPLSFDPAAGDVVTDTIPRVDGLTLGSVSHDPVWDVATTDPGVAALLSLEYDLDVMLVGGFLRRDPILSAEEVIELSQTGVIGFVHRPDLRVSRLDSELHDLLEDCELFEVTENGRKFYRCVANP